MNIELYNRFLKHIFDLKIYDQDNIENVTYIRNGELIRRKDWKIFIIKNYIPRFVEEDNYTDSFGFQWNKFRTLQHDSRNNRKLSEKRLKINTGWSDRKLFNKVVLECGCGPGRYTEVLYKMVGGEGIVITVDMSNAIDVNLENLGLHPNVLYIQDDITNLYYMKEKADYVFCYGVLQHTPNPRKTLQRLGIYLKIGGELSIDVYAKTFKPNPFYGPKYFWRPITKHMDKKKLLKVLEWYIPKYIKFDTRLRKKLWGKYILGMIPIPCWNYIDRGYSDSERLQHAIMDTFDALSPQYDRPCSYNELTDWAEQENYKKFRVFYGHNGLVLNAIR